MLGMAKVEGVWAVDYRRGARRSSAVGGGEAERASAMARRRKRMREGCSGIGRLYQTRLMRRA